MDFFANDQKSVLKVMKMLERLLLVFCGKHDEEVWRERKMEILFRPITGGLSIFASMFQVYLNLTYKLFEVSAKIVGYNGNNNAQLWLRREALEACYRLLELARNCSHDPEEILEFGLQPILNSNIFKWLAEIL
jgi:hypothetical protein